MSKQPQALRLADWLEKWARDYAGTQLEDMALTDAAAELRRLHNENAALRAGEAFHKVAVQQRDAAWRERDAAELMSLALKAQRDELLEALRGCVNDYCSEDGMYAEKHYVRIFSEAIAKVEGKQ